MNAKQTLTLLRYASLNSLSVSEGFGRLFYLIKFTGLCGAEARNNCSYTRYWRISCRFYCFYALFISNIVILVKNSCEVSYTTLQFADVFLFVWLVCISTLRKWMSFSRLCWKKNPMKWSTLLELLLYSEMSLIFTYSWFRVFGCSYWDNLA